MPPRGAYPDDHTPPPEPVESLPLFQEPPFPTRPEVKQAEQRLLELPRTPEAILAAWRATEEGAEVYAWIERRAVELVGQGATRLSAKMLLEDARWEFKHTTDNRITSALSRALMDEHPVLRGMFELRQRSA